MGWGVSLMKSNNVFITDTYIIGFRPIGLHLDFVRNVTVTNSIIADVKERKFGDSAGIMADMESCVAVCSYMNGGQGSPCYDMKLTNNVAAGCTFAGFIAPGHDCDTESERFNNNIAHSVKGTGAAVYPDEFTGKNHRKCYEISHFKGYKTTNPCLASFYQTYELRAHDITCIDT